MGCRQIYSYSLLALAAVTVWASGTGWAVTDEEVGQAIDRIKQYFYERQDQDTGSWEFRSKLAARKHDVQQAGGETALVTQALLVSGESSQNPNIAKALKFLREAKMHGSYAVAVRTHVWSYLPQEYINLLEADAGWLMEMATKHKLGLFGYTIALAEKNAAIDHSSTQYGMLGLWQASKRGMRIPTKFWEGWVEHFIKFQLDDGGWNYGRYPSDKSSGAMTAAGLTALYVGQQELYRSRKAPEPKITEAIQKGLGWLDKRFKGVSNINKEGEYNYYFIYGIERVALASGVKFLNQKDWYQTCASHIVNEVKETGSIGDDYVDTAFALMFLARGRYPVWINKLEVPGKRWNNHPNDLYFLSQYLSNQREGEVNWQVVSVDSNPEDWLIAPVAYLASNEAVEFNDTQKAAIKRYLDMGGLLVANPDDGSPAFTSSIKKLAQDLYPDYKLERLAPDHGLFDSWHRLTDTRAQAVTGLSNGARQLILLAESDWGFSLQADKEPGKSPVWQLAANLFAYATNRGVLNNRLVPPYDQRVTRSKNGSIVIGRARYEGNWLPEPAVWEIQANHVYNRTGLDIQTTPAQGEEILDLEEIGSCDLKLIHLIGTDPITLTDPQRTAIKQYLERGGTILIETAGGKGQFSRSLETQLSELLDQRSVPMRGSDPIISGDGLIDGYDNRRALYRQYTVLRFKPDPSPHLIAFLDDDGDRPMVILSHEDLSLGMLGCRHWGIMGYQPEVSRKIVTNVVLWANRQELQ